MSNIENVDNNFKIETKINKADIKFRDARTEPFKIHGVFYEGDRFRRMPEAVAKTVSEGVYILHSNTAGGRLRFRTDSPYIAINVKMPTFGRMSHFALCGSSGFDLYVDGRHCMSFLPPFDTVDGYENILELGTHQMRDIMIHMPLYSDVSEFYVGLCEDAKILEPAPYKIEKPIVFYGSSITQGGCASRPGTAYQGFVSRDLDADFINLGFSGNARAEAEISQYIASLDMSAFVYDYDHNAPSIEHLERTHERMFLEIRSAQPTLPIIIMPRPKHVLNNEEEKRLAIIKKTYENAIARGDKNVYFISNSDLTAICGVEGTVDRTHPTDLGFFSMAAAVTNLLRKIFE